MTKEKRDYLDSVIDQAVVKIPFGEITLELQVAEPEDRLMIMAHVDAQPPEEAEPELLDEWGAELMAMCLNATVMHMSRPRTPKEWETLLLSARAHDHSDPDQKLRHPVLGISRYLCGMANIDVLMEGKSEEIINAAVEQARENLDERIKREEAAHTEADPLESVMEDQAQTNLDNAGGN